MSATRVETQPAPRRLTIGAVCELLRPEFTDLSISKIRYLEDQGLLEPHRTRGAIASSARPTSSGCDAS